MQKLELKEKRANMRMVNSNELLAMTESNMAMIDVELYNLAMKYEDLYFLVDEGVKGIAIPPYRPQLLERLKRKKPIKQRAMSIIDVIENGRRQEYILIML